MKVMLFPELEEARIEEIGEELEDLQKAVGGGLIEPFYPFQEDDLAIICNEEGKINGMMLNMPVVLEGVVIDIIHGPFFICANGEEDFEGLTDEQIERIKAKIKNSTSEHPLPLVDGISYVGQYIDAG